MARPADPEARRKQISQAAITVFARDGYQSAAVDDIAAEAGLSKGSIYRYFADKEALFHAAFEAVQAEVLTESEQAMAQESRAWDQLSALVRTSVTGWQRNLTMFPLVLEIWAAASAGPARERLGTVMADMYRSYREHVAALIRQGQTEGDLAPDADPEATAAWLVAATDGLLLQHWFDPAVDPTVAADQLLTTLGRGLQTDEQGQEGA